jgi:hypothetical protein
LWELIENRVGAKTARFAGPAQCSWRFLFGKRIARCGHDAQCAKVLVEPRECKENVESFCADENRVKAGGSEARLRFRRSRACAMKKKRERDQKRNLCRNISRQTGNAARIVSAQAKGWRHIEHRGDSGIIALRMPRTVKIGASISQDGRSLYRALDRGVRNRPLFHDEIVI